MKPFLAGFERTKGPADGFEASISLGGSLVSDKIGDIIKFDHDFVGRRALETMKGRPHLKVVFDVCNETGSVRVAGVI